MSFTIDTQITCYLLPDDGPGAYAQFLKNLTDPGETWIIAYAQTGGHPTALFPWFLGAAAAILVLSFIIFLFRRGGGNGR